MATCFNPVEIRGKILIKRFEKLFKIGTKRPPNRKLIKNLKPEKTDLWSTGKQSVLRITKYIEIPMELENYKFLDPCPGSGDLLLALNVVTIKQANQPTQARA